MKKLGLVCILLVVLSGMCWAQTGYNLYSTPTLTKDMTPTTVEQKKEEAPATETKAEWMVPMALPEAAPELPVAIMPEKVEEPAIDKEAVMAEVEEISAQISAAKAAGLAPSDALERKLGELETLLNPSHGAVNSLDQGGGTCATATVIPSSATMNYCVQGVMDAVAASDCPIVTGIYYMYRDVYYSFVPTTTGRYILSMCGSIGDTQLKVWADNCCTGTFYKQDDDSCSGQSDPRTAIILNAGTTYYIHLGYYSASQAAAAYNLYITGPVPDAPPVPANDVCASAIAIGVPSSTAGTTFGATTETTISCGGTTSRYWGVWYTVVGTGRYMTARIAPTCTNFYPRIAVFKTATCLPPAGTCANGGGTGSLPVEVKWCSDAGQTYLICVSSYNSATNMRGDFTMDILDGGECACNLIPLCGPSGETEPNTTCAMAGTQTAIGCDQTVYGLHCAEADSDYFKITIPAGRGMSIKVYDGDACSTYPPTKIITKWSSAACGTPTTVTGAKVFSRCASATDTTVYLFIQDYGTTAPINRTPYKIVTQCFSAASNDLCDNADGAGVPSSTFGQTICATTDAGLPVCGGLTPASPGVWYKVTGNGNSLTADVCNADFDTKINVYTGSCGTFTCVAANDNGGMALPCNSQASKITWCSTPDVTYYVLVYGYSSTYMGTFTLNITDGELCTPPANDLCDNAVIVPVPSATPGYISFGTVDAPPYCYATPAAPGVWYKVIGNGNLLTADACDANFDNKINVYKGPDCMNLTCVGGDNDLCDAPNTLGAKYTWCSTQDEIYWILVYGAYSTNTIGTFVLNITDGEPCGPAPNDLCAGAINVAIPSATNGTTLYNTLDTPPLCVYTPTAPGVWYTVIGNGNTLTADLCTNFTFDSRLNIYTGDCDNLVCLDADDDDCPSSTGALVSWCSDLNVTYYILVHGYSANAGTYTLTITDGANCHINCETFLPCGTPAEVEPNDACANFANFQTLTYAIDGSPTDKFGTICPMTDVDYWYVPAFPVGSTLTITLFDSLDCSSPASSVLMYGATATDGSCTTPGTSGTGQYVLTGCTPNTGGYIAVKNVVGYGDKYKIRTVWTPAPDCPSVALPNQYSIGPCVGNITDYTTVAYPINVPIQYHITDLNVRVNLIHTYDGDIDLYLVTPWLDTLDLSTDNGAGGDNYTNTVFDDQATTLVTAGVAPFLGSYIPEELLAAVNNYNAVGVWQFLIGDDAGGDVGSVYCLSLEFQYDYILSVEMLGGLVATPGDGSVTLTWATASETNNARYEILRDGELVGTLNGALNSSTRIDYTWSDDGVTNGRTYRYSLVTVDALGARGTVATASVMPSVMAGPVTEYTLRQNYPNPFNPTTTIAFDLVESGFVTLKIYNVMGQSVATVVNGTMNAGRHSVSFDARNLSSGIYLYRIEANGFSAEKKMLLMK